MYCPSCSSHNQDEVKFCTRCGTNLGVVSDALSGRLATQSPIDERMVTLFKDYYRGRNGIIIGSAASAIALVAVALFVLTGFHERGEFLGTITAFLLLYGIIALASGLARWSRSSSEIKAIERAGSHGASFRSAEDHPALLSGEPASIRTGALSTDPIVSPVSVTEQTTRLLHESEYEQPPEPEQGPRR